MAHLPKKTAVKLHFFSNRDKLALIRMELRLAGFPHSGGVDRCALQSGFHQMRITVDVGR